ncbi:MAG: 3-dehydroquinate synthase [Coriobacteriia bacterium]|nr:3-dehydroquinate synthase [Coriobacteriia bacterium]
MGIQRLKVVLAEGKGYDIRVGAGVLAGLGGHLREVTRSAGASPAAAAPAAAEAATEVVAEAATKAVVITDSNVGPLYLDAVRASLSEAGFEAFDLTIPAGEGSKNLAVATELWEALALLGIGRGDLVVGLGGGVVCDLAGFVASTYMRGIACALVPTSLLAMVDASIGGKTAVNLAGGKNLVGTFRQPVYVAVDIEALATLPAAEWENGFAELAKSALVDGGGFYRWLVENAVGLCAHDEAVVQQAIVQALTFKARVVASDELEAGPRECLNYGHTFAHALEALSGYTLSHGRAVAEGMRFAARLGTEAATVMGELVNEQDGLIVSLGIEPVRESYGADELFQQLYADKKVRGGELRFVFVCEPGEWEVAAVDPDLVKIYLIYWEQAKVAATAAAAAAAAAE